MAAVDPEDMADQASGLVLSLLAKALGERDHAHVILAGGGTPRATYGLVAAGIAQRGLPRERIHWSFGDERWVPVGDPQSNEGMARAALLGPLGAPEETIHSWHAGDGDPVECAAGYRVAIAPDIVILGMGPDGHTASLFPGATARLPGGIPVPVSAALPGTAAAIEPGSGRGWRLTLCPAILRSARAVLFLVSGEDKAPAFRRAVDGDPSTPAAWIRGGETIFVATRDVMENGGRDTRHA
jgi:6-phosphogluconolactonase